MIDFEDELQKSFGVNKIEDFNQKKLVDLYACVECGLCTNMCPVIWNGKNTVSNGFNSKNNCDIVIVSYFY